MGKTKIKDDINYMQSQTMRNNLIRVFGNIPEETNETPVRSEQIIKDFIISKLKIAKEEVDNMRFERVHRMVRRLMRVQQERGAVLDIAVAVLCVSSRFSATARKCVATVRT